MSIAVTNLWVFNFQLAVQAENWRAAKCILINQQAYNRWLDWRQYATAGHAAAIELTIIGVIVAPEPLRTAKGGKQSKAVMDDADWEAIYMPMFVANGLPLRASITDPDFWVFLSNNPETLATHCRGCSGTGWVSCNGCGDLALDDPCVQCGLLGAIHCSFCGNTGLAVWWWWRDAYVIERIKQAYWDAMVAGVYTAPPMPGQVYWFDHQGPVRSVAVVAAADQSGSD